ncbi:MAG: hypothetical protein AUH31_09195 [Armatimonadetes bacterium 13_1_40CM_64_14]|nr:MAG: hypothetical protein AUH31_09195 [Armatimonadetes bacterium 13_1_40CM_64_14]
MRGAIVAFALVLTVLGAVPVEASLPGGDWNTEDGLLIFLSQLHRQIDGILAWIAGVADYSEAAFQSLAPIFDRAYSAQVLARRIDGLATGGPRRFQEVLRGFAGRLRTIPLPRPGTPRWVIEQVIHASPHGETAQQAQALDQVTEENVAALATALSATEAARIAASQIVDDLSPQAQAQVAMSAARDLAIRAQYTPSTRAAVQLLVEAMAAQIDLQSHTAESVIGRQTAAIQQQTLLSLQLAAVVDRLATLNDQENAHQKDRLAQHTAAGVGLFESQRQTFAEIAQSLLTLNSLQQQQEMDRFFAVLTKGVVGRADALQP